MQSLMIVWSIQLLDHSHHGGSVPLVNTPVGSAPHTVASRQEPFPVWDISGSPIGTSASLVYVKAQHTYRKGLHEAAS